MIRRLHWLSVAMLALLLSGCEPACDFWDEQSRIAEAALAECRATEGCRVTLSDIETAQTIRGHSVRCKGRK